MSLPSALIYPPQGHKRYAQQSLPRRDTPTKALVSIALLFAIITIALTGRYINDLLKPELATLSSLSIIETQSSQQQHTQPYKYFPLQTPAPTPTQTDPDGDGGEDDDDPTPKPTVKCEKISEQTDQCAFVKENCKSNGLLNYLSFRYCTLGHMGAGGTILTVVLFAILLAVLIKSLGATADISFVPSLELVASELRMSPAVSGLTLISLGNAAPDILTAITSVKKGAAEGDIGLVLGSLSGAQCCIGCLVLGAAVISAYKFKPSSTRLGRGQFVRAMAGLIICTLPAIGLCAKGSLRWWDSVILIGVYVTFVVFNVIYLQRQEAKKQKAALEKRKKVYIQSTSSYQVQQSSRSLKENLLELDDGRFETADGSSNHNKSSLSLLPGADLDDIDTGNNTGYEQPTELQVETMNYDQQQQLEHNINTSTPQRGFSLRNMIAMSAKNLLEDEEEDEDDEDDNGGDSEKLQATVDGVIQYDSEGVPIPQPDNAIDGGDDDDDEEDQTYFMGGLMFDPDWSKPNQTFVQKWVLGGIFKFLWLLCLPISFLRWLSVPSCHHRPDYFRGPKKIALHVSFFFSPLLFGLAFVGVDDFAEKKLIWIILACLSVVLVVALNIFYFWFVSPAVDKYNTRRREVQEIVANKKDEDHLEDYQLKEISELMLQFNIDRADEDAKPTSMRIFMLFCSAMAFIGALAWLSLIAGELVEILSALGTMFSLSQLFLGLTVLAMGNSVVDAAANLGLASKGRMVVAYSSIFNAPVSASSFGFGIAVLITTLTTQYKVISYKVSATIILCWGAVIGAIVFNCISIPWFFNYRPTPKFGYILSGYYACFVIAAIIFEFAL